MKNKRQPKTYTSVLSLVQDLTPEAIAGTRKLIRKTNAKKRSGLDPFHYHEVMDRADVVLRLFDDAVASHPVVKAKGNEALKEACDKAATALAAVYMVAGGLAYQHSGEQGATAQPK